MRDQLERRLHDLKGEFEAGQRMLTDLEARQQQLRETILRISGAIQVIEELLASPVSESPLGQEVAVVNGQDL